MTFAREILVGDELLGYMRFVERNHKLCRGVVIALNTRDNTVASIVEFLEVHVNLATRKSTPWHESIATAIDREIQRSETLDWPAPDSGTISLKRPQ